MLNFVHCMASMQRCRSEVDAHEALHDDFDTQVGDKDAGDEAKAGRGLLR